MNLAKRSLQKVQRLKAKLSITIPFILSRIIARTHWEATIGGTTVKLTFQTPLHHFFAREAHRLHPEAPLLISWINFQAKVVYDIGGYNGLYGLLYAKAHPNAQVTIFEPDTINANHIEANIVLNQLGNCVCKRAAVSDVSGTARFSQGGRTKEHIGAGESEVAAITLNALPPADLIKIDVEGAEVRVLSTLNAKSVVLCELHQDDFLARYGDSREAFFQWITQTNRKAWLIADRGTEQHYLLF